jgi:DNA polymerase-3 subunit alpha
MGAAQRLVPIICVEFMQQPGFVHLHLHTQYSLLDGAIRLHDLVRTALEFQMSAVAITDHGAMFGAIEFYEKCKGAGIKPIIGAELYVAPGSRFDKETGHGHEAITNHHLVLLCENL